MLANNFGADGEKVRAFLAAQGLPPEARAEAVPAAVWLALSRHL
jgi:hypothetical protein